MRRPIPPSRDGERDLGLSEAGWGWVYPQASPVRMKHSTGKKTELRIECSEVRKKKCTAGVGSFLEAFICIEKKR